MSSLGSFPDWTVFGRRQEIALEAEDFTSPGAVAGSIVDQRHQGERLAVQAMVEERDALLSALISQAKNTYQLIVSLERYKSAIAQNEQLQAPMLNRSARSLGIIQKQMQEDLAKCGITLDIPLGKTYEEVADLVNIESWRHSPEYRAEVVAEVIEPIIRYRDRLVYTGRVIMGSPADADISNNDA